MIKELEMDTLSSLLGLIFTTIASFMIMLCIYGLILLIIGRLNPITFYKNIREGMLTSFTLSSSNAAMPINMRICTEKLGISPRVSNFSIPLGATVNMDGGCITLSVMSLFLAKMNGVTVDPSTIAPLAITIILLSLGAPGVPGAIIVCTGVVLNQLNCPIESINFVLAVLAFNDMFSTMTNTTGDMAVTTVVAKTEKLLDKDKYYS
jgi:Na+/H+-dicarboxylate symporter